MFNVALCLLCFAQSLSLVKVYLLRKNVVWFNIFYFNLFRCEYKTAQVGLCFGSAFELSIFLGYPSKHLVE
jgi:hypothetical protein